MNWYVGVNNKSKTVTNAYIGVNGQSRKIQKAYIGVNGISRLFYDVDGPVNFTVRGTQYSMPKGSTWLDFFTEYPSAGSCYWVNPTFSTSYYYQYGHYPSGHEYYVIGNSLSVRSINGKNIIGYYEYYLNGNRFSSYDSYFEMLTDQDFNNPINNGDVITEVWHSITSRPVSTSTMYGQIFSDMINVTFLGETVQIHRGMTVVGAFGDNIRMLLISSNSDSYIFGTDPTFIHDSESDLYYINYDAYLVNNEPLSDEPGVSYSIVERGYRYSYKRSLSKVLSDGDIITSVHVEGTEYIGMTRIPIEYPVNLKI